MKEEADFFSSLSTSEVPAPGPDRPVPVSAPETRSEPEQSGAPDVSIGLSAPVAAPLPKKSTIGAKKAPAKKSGLGARKGGKPSGYNLVCDI